MTQQDKAKMSHLGIKFLTQNVTKQPDIFLDYNVTYRPLLESVLGHLQMVSLPLVPMVCMSDWL